MDSETDPTDPDKLRLRPHALLGWLLVAFVAGWLIDKPKVFEIVLLPILSSFLGSLAGIIIIGGFAIALVIGIFSFIRLSLQDLWRNRWRGRLRDWLDK